MSRPMAESSLPAPCPHGHADTVKLLSTVALTGAPTAFAAPPRATAGGCCGGTCGCN